MKLGKIAWQLPIQERLCDTLTLLVECSLVERHSGIDDDVVAEEDLVVVVAVAWADLDNTDHTARRARSRQTCDTPMTVRRVIKIVVAT